MKLVFDIGNTRIKWGLAANGEIGAAASVAHGPDSVTEMISALPGDIREAWAVNVAGADIETELQAALMERFGIRLRLIRSAARFGELVNGYAAFEQLGADRWAAIAGAWYRYRERVCVVDAGTAVTIDTVEADGQHRGGLILPGLRLMAATLNRETSDIEGFSSRSAGPVADADWYGKDTRSAVQRGAHFALQAAIRQAAAPMAEAAPPRLIMTGGDAEALMPHEGIACEHRPELVLEGVLVLSGDDNA